MPLGLGAREAMRLVKEVGMEQMKEAISLLEEKSDEGSRKTDAMQGNTEDVKSGVSVDKINKSYGGDAKTGNTGVSSAKKWGEDIFRTTAGLPAVGAFGVEGVKKEEVEVNGERKRAPSICSCEYEFFHSRLLHEHSSLQKH